MASDFVMWELELLLSNCNACIDDECRLCIARPRDSSEWCMHDCDWLYPDSQRPRRTR